MNVSAPIPKFHRQKLVLALVQSFGGKLTNIDLQKYLFLFTQLCQQEKSYEFVPYNYGCFSFQSHADRSRLVEMGVIANSPDNWQLTTESDYVALLREGERKKLAEFSQRYSGLSGGALVREIYVKYPYYAINSEIADRLLNRGELKQVAQARPAEEGALPFHDRVRRQVHRVLPESTHPEQRESAL